MATLQERLDAESLPVETASDQAIRTFRTMGIGRAEIERMKLFGEPVESYSREALIHALAYFVEKHTKASQLPKLLRD